MLKSKSYGEYKIIDLLGKGGYGNVYLAQKDNIKFAIKCIDKDRIIEDNLGDSIKTEILLMRMIRHPYIVKLCNVMTTQQKIILVMEYVEGGDLFDYIVNQPDKKMSEEDARLFFQQIIMAMDYCHALKIVHRDLKPENILIDKNNNSIKISDFGLSTLLKHNDEMIQNACGTPNYLAPEVMKQTGGYLGQAADIWGAGVILYNMVTGKNPFHNSDQNVLLKNILSGNAEYPKYLSKSIIDLLSKIFVANPQKRFTIENIKEHHWFKVNFEPVKGYLKDQNYEINEIKEIEDNDDATINYNLDSPKKTKKPISSNKNFFIDIFMIPIINCFELSTLLTGKWISKMFEVDESKLVNLDDAANRYSYEFTCDLKYDQMAKIIDSYFNKLFKDTNYVNYDNGKFVLEFYFSANVSLNIFLQVYKITEEKLILSFRYKDGDKSTFIKMMNDFCIENSNYFNLF